MASQNGTADHFGKDRAASWRVLCWHIVGEGSKTQVLSVDYGRTATLFDPDESGRYSGMTGNYYPRKEK
jgi:hypothetical protein